MSWRAALGAWVRIAALSFGGPAGQIAVMHRILVQERRWISERGFLHALNFCMLLPGPEAMQLVTYCGWRLHGIPGGLLAGTLFVLPGFLSILGLSVLYAAFQEASLVTAIFFGLQAAVLAVVLHAVWSIGRRALRGPLALALACAAFIATFCFAVPFPLILACAAAIGFASARMGSVKPCVHSTFAPLAAPGGQPSTPPPPSAGIRAHAPTRLRVAGIATVGLLAWFGPLALLAAVVGPADVLVTQGLFFSKTAVITFGGAYAVLSYVAEQAVEVFGWLRPGEMLDGIGMAETTPGPLIQVVQFVGFLGAYRDPGGFSPITAGVLGSLVTTWVTFVPCFLWIFLGAPFVELLNGRPALSAALAAITASVVGVILNLAVGFGLHVLFEQVTRITWHGLRLLVPAWSTIDPVATIIAGAALLALSVFRVGLLWTLAGSVLVGTGWHLLMR